MPPFQGLRLVRTVFPGRCPGLYYARLSGGRHERARDACKVQRPRAQQAPRRPTRPISLKLRRSPTLLRPRGRSHSAKASSRRDWPITEKGTARGPLRACQGSRLLTGLGLRGVKTLFEVLAGAFWHPSKSAEGRMKNAGMLGAGANVTAYAWRSGGSFGWVHCTADTKLWIAGVVWDPASPVPPRPGQVWPRSRRIALDAF